MFAALFPIGALALSARNPIFDITFQHIPSRHTLVRTKNGPATEALEACGTNRVNTHDLSTLDGACELETPSVGTECEVWPLPPRPVQVGGKRRRRMETRLGRNAGGGGANYVMSAKSATPALRKVGVREISGAPSAQEQAGYPPPMNTDTFLGYSCAGYQSSEVAGTARGVDGGALVRLVGQTSKGRKGRKKVLVKKAKVGLWPCCAAATHVALPPAFALGAADALKAQGAHLRKEFSS